MHLAPRIRVAGLILHGDSVLLLRHEKDLAIAFCSECMRSSTRDLNWLTDARRMALLRNPRLNATVAECNRRQRGKMTFIDCLADQPVIAQSIATASSIPSPTALELAQ